MLLSVLHAGEAEFHTGWFVESLATQTLVLFVIRTSGNPFSSRPSRALTATTLGIVLLGMVLPFTPIGTKLEFTPLPPIYFGFLAAATVTYLFLVEFAKRFLMHKTMRRAHRSSTASLRSSCRRWLSAGHSDAGHISPVDAWTRVKGTHWRPL